MADQPLSKRGCRAKGKDGEREIARLLADLCPHCKRETWAYRFESPDGVRVESHRCREHGDVVPMRSAVANLPRFGEGS